MSLVILLSSAWLSLMSSARAYLEIICYRRVVLKCTQQYKTE
nr:MAG TPA_asm: rich Proline-rich [Caudoviricetes sp.]